jgi:DNA polymerase I-like protein with 3'-5' exonuclease and polymerase domains
MLGIDIEGSKKPALYPWHSGHYLSIVSTYEPDGTKTTFYFTHNETMDIDHYKERARLQKLIDKYDIMVGHNIKFDLNNLKCFGLKFEGKRFFCTMVAQYLLDCHQHKSRDLSTVAKRYGLKPKDDKVKTMWDAGYDTHQIPLSILVPYCEHDTELTFKIATKQLTHLRTQGLFKCFNLSMEFLDLLSDMEIKGLVFDLKQARAIVVRYNKLLAVLKDKATKILIDYIDPNTIDEFNIKSNEELSAALYGGYIKRKVKGPKITKKNVKVKMPYIFTYKTGKKKVKVRVSQHPDTPCLRYVYNEKQFNCTGMGFEPLPRTKITKSTTKDGFVIDYIYYKVDKDTLPFLKCKTLEQKRIIKLCLKISKIQKMVETFEGKTKKTGLLTKVGTDGLLHTNYNQAVTATGRLSSSNPNSQNLPTGTTSPVKKCFLPHNDLIMDADLSSIELRVPAQFAQDKVMIKEINSGEDLHANTGRDHFNGKGTRTHWKIFNFGMIYGRTEYGYYSDPKMPDFKMARWTEIIRAYYYKYTGIKSWHEKLIATAIKSGGTLTTETGRIYKFILNTTGYNAGKFNENQIKNYPVQGTAGADILPLAAVIIQRAFKRLGLKSFFILTVHDSIVIDIVKEEVDIIADLIMNVFTNLPKYIKQYFGINWIVNLTGEIEVGPNYGTLKQIR